MCKDNEQEVRQRWRESDGFAKAGQEVGRSYHDRMRDSVVLDPRNTQAAQGLAESPLVRFHHEVDTINTIGRSPLFVSMALGFHTQLDYQPVPYPAQREICEQMVKLGLLREDPVDGARFMHYVPVQEALRIYVEALCRVPLPVKRWVLP